MVREGWAIKNWGNYKELIAVRLPVKIKKELMEKAKQRGLSLSDLVRIYIERCLAEENKNEIVQKSNKI
jgi:post-segregation antitoxin (ccd killing protein)